MDRILELEGKNLDQLVERACEELGCLPEDLEIDILEFNAGGMLGTGRKIKANFKIKTEKLLSKRANRALTFLTELFYHLDFKVEMQTMLKKEAMEIDIILSGEDVKYLLQNGGEALTAIEFLLNKVVAKSMGIGPKINLKVKGIDLEREKKLLRAVKRAITLIKEDQKERTIKIGNKREERLVLNLVKEDPNIEASIIEEEKGKKIVLKWKNQ
ncbi:MAG: Jag N-terminal domain-containing protein [Caldimicrobium sp.]